MSRIHADFAYTANATDAAAKTSSNINTINKATPLCLPMF